MEQYAAQIIGAIVLGLLIWLARETHANGRTLAQIKVRLFGYEHELEGGLAGEVSKLTRRVERLEEQAP